MSHSVRFVMDDDDTVFKGRVLKSATGRQRQTTMVTKTPLQSETSSVPRWSSTAMDYTRKRRLLQKRSAKSRPNSPQNSGYTSLRRTFQYGVVRHREYYREYEVKFNGSPLMLLPNARVRAQVNLDMFGSSLREGSVIPVDPNTTLQLSTVAGVFNPTHGAYGVRNPRWDRPMSSSGVVEIENGQLRYQRILTSRPSSVGDDSLPSSQSPEVESNSERALSDHLVAPEYPEDLDSLFPVTTPSAKDRLPAYLDNYAKEAEVKLFGRRRNTIANIPSSSLPNPGQEKRISIDLPPVNHLNGIANYLDWIFTTFGDRKELQHLPRNNYVVRGSNPYFTNFVYKVPLHERVDGGEGQDDEEQVRQHPPQKSPLQPGRQNSYRVRRRHSVPVNLKAKAGCSGAEGRPGSPSSSVTRTDLDEDEMDMTVEFKNLIGETWLQHLYHTN
ncbi:uncharacterized protein LOC135476451 [Liolophura sinensis]|uniref:uncharacterized protein LOC135476451 n=1 Tax=Liolophura sinensis TaxID=3198878 RepID=UPI00315974D0